MNKAVLITKSGKLFNIEMLHALLEQGCSVAMPFKDASEADEYANGLAERSRRRFFPVDEPSSDEADVKRTVDQAVRRMGGLHLLIHGAEVRDEEADYELNAVMFGRGTAESLRSRFLYSRAAAAHMVRNKTGHIVFLLLADRLYYAGYPSSPVMNNGTLAMMRTLAKELSPFRIAVNAVTYGYYAAQVEQADRKALKQQLEIHTLKPYIPQQQELVAASLTWLLHTPEHLVSGQNICIGAGVSD